MTRSRAMVFAPDVSAALLTMVTAASADDAILRTTLTGAAERPGPGDPDATGQATIYIDDDIIRLCLSMNWSNVDGTLSGLHIHIAPPDARPHRHPLHHAADRRDQDVRVCRGRRRGAARQPGGHPQQYYINLDSTPLYPGGALRGQLPHAF